MKKKVLMAGVAAALGAAVLPASLAGVAGASTHRASGTYTVGFANEATTAPFQINVQNSMTKWAAKDGFKLISLNNNYDDATALRNAQILANDKVNIAIEFQVDAKIAPAIAAIFKKVNIPTISIDIPQPGAIFFGASNFADGELLGQKIGLYIKSHHWDPKTTTEVLLNLPAAGAIPQLRMDGVDYGIREEFPALPKSALIEQNGQGTVSDSQTLMAELLPKIPTTNHIIISGINDESSQGALRAVQVAGREANTIVGSQGADAVGLGEIRTDSHWIGDTGYFPEFYGKYLMQLVESIKAGKHVTPYVFMPRAWIDKATLKTYYPGNTTVAAAPPPGGLQFSTTPRHTL